MSCNTLADWCSNPICSVGTDFCSWVTIRPCEVCSLYMQDGVLIGEEEQEVVLNNDAALESGANGSRYFDFNIWIILLLAIIAIGIILAGTTVLNKLRLGKQEYKEIGESTINKCKTDDTQNIV